MDENDRVYLGGYPGPLREMLGIWAEETDALSPEQKNEAVFIEPFGEMSGSYGCGLLCDRIHTEGAQVLARYGQDFYAGEPVVTRNFFGQGHAYYLASDLEAPALRGFYQELCIRAGITPALPQVLAGVEAVRRVAPDGQALLYVLNHNTGEVEAALPPGRFSDLLSGEALEGRAILAAYGVRILAAQAD